MYSHVSTACYHFSLTFSDFRVHYLRGRAQKYRWEEEHKLLQYEMEWTTRWFTGQARLWDQRALQAYRNALNVSGAVPVPPQATDLAYRGAAAYARRKSAMYKTMALDAQVKFLHVNPKFVPIV